MNFSYLTQSLQDGAGYLSSNAKKMIISEEPDPTDKDEVKDEE